MSDDDIDDFTSVTHPVEPTHPVGTWLELPIVVNGHYGTTGVATPVTPTVPKQQDAPKQPATPTVVVPKQPVVSTTKFASIPAKCIEKQPPDVLVLPTQVPVKPREPVKPLEPIMRRDEPRGGAGPPASPPTTLEHPKSVEVGKTPESVRRVALTPTGPQFITAPYHPLRMSARTFRHAWALRDDVFLQGRTTAWDFNDTDLSSPRRPPSPPSSPIENDDESTRWFTFNRVGGRSLGEALFPRRK